MSDCPRRPPSSTSAGALLLALVLIACPSDNATPALTSATEGTTALAVLNFGEVTCSTLNRIYCVQQ